MSPSLRVFNRGQPECHVGARRRQHHVLRIKLNTLHGPRMICIQYANFIPRICVPNVYPPIRRSAEYKLWIGTEGRLDRYPFVVEMPCECLKRSTVERIDKSDYWAVRAYQNRLAVSWEFQTGPVALLLLGQFEGDERAFVERAKIVQFDAFGIDAGCENESFGIVCGDWSAGKVH